MGARVGLLYGGIEDGGDDDAVYGTCLLDWIGLGYDSLWGQIGPRNLAWAVDIRVQESIDTSNS